jgi:hypothetical protein
LKTTKKTTKKKKTKPDQSKITLLKKWVEHHKNMDEINHCIMEALGLREPPSVVEEYWKLFDSYTELVAKMVGDKHEWLNWYCWENKMGESGLEAGFNKKLHPIKTLEDLLRLIEDV